MIAVPKFELSAGQLLVRVGSEVHSLGIYPPADSKSASMMLMKIFFLGVRAKRHEIAAVLAGVEDREIFDV